MSDGKVKKRKIIGKLKSKYRLVIMNDDTFEEKASWKLTPMNVFVSIGIFIISFTFLLTYVIAFTPLREYIPGYADVNMQRQLRKMVQKADDLSEELQARDLYIKNLDEIVKGAVGKDIDETSGKSRAGRYDSLKALTKLPRSAEDEKLRQAVEASNKGKK